MLIAAHDGTGTIGATAASLKSRLEEWPGSSLWVISEHGHDRVTADAASAGAQVAVRESGRSGKGAMIAWWLQRYEAVWQSREAIVILDASSRLTEGSLRALRTAILNGADAAQAQVAPEGAGRLAGRSDVLTPHLDDEARMRCGWSVPLRGTGMAFRCKVLAELAPRLHQFAEDLELDFLLAARGARVELVPEAMVYHSKPNLPTGISNRCLRWFQWRLHVLLNCRREIRTAFVGGNIGNWFLIWPLLLRPKLLFVGARLVMLPVFPRLALAGLALDAVYYLAGVATMGDPRRLLYDLDIFQPRKIGR